LNCNVRYFEILKKKRKTTTKMPQNVTDDNNNKNKRSVSADINVKQSIAKRSFSSDRPRKPQEEIPLSFASFYYSLRVTKGKGKQNQTHQ
jgi:hypothetical protein